MKRKRKRKRKEKKRDGEINILHITTLERKKDECID